MTVRTIKKCGICGGLGHFDVVYWTLGYVYAKYNKYVDGGLSSRSTCPTCKGKGQVEAKE